MSNEEKNNNLLILNSKIPFSVLPLLSTVYFYRFWEIRRLTYLRLNPFDIRFTRIYWWSVLKYEVLVYSNTPFIWGRNSRDGEWSLFVLLAWPLLLKHSIADLSLPITVYIICVNKSRGNWLPGETYSIDSNACSWTKNGPFYFLRLLMNWVWNTEIRPRSIQLFS